MAHTLSMFGDSAKLGAVGAFSCMDGSGAAKRVGEDFDTFGVVWQYRL